MITARRHAQWTQYYGHWAANISHEVISVTIDGQRHVLHHFCGTDCRGSHYGQSFESYDLIRDPRQRQHFLRKYIGRVEVSKELVTALSNSKSKSVFRNGELEFPIEDQSWCLGR